MKLCKMTILIAVAGIFLASAAFAQDAVRQPSSVLPIGYESVENFEFDSSSYYAENGEFVSNTSVLEGESGESCNSCGGGGCSSCGLNLDFLSRLGCCDLGEPWTAWGAYGPCDSCINVGMWTQFGYHDESNGLFNNRPDKFNLHQQYFYIEKVAQGGECRLDWGFRVDAVYGIDGADTQSFGNDPGDWDFQNGFDHGSYAWALPQFYAELAYNDLNLKVGHFYTPAGYEVVMAPGNFFYSHAITHVLSEPFTHTGLLATYQWDECTEVYGGWTLGWDTGFSQFGGGNSGIGGFARQMNDRVKFTYISTFGDFGRRSLDDEKSYSHSIIVDMEINDCWTYVLESDYLLIEEQGEDNVSIVNYLFYEYSPCLSFGARVEWWQGDAVTNYTYGGQIPALTGGTHSYYDATFGVNYKPCANLTIRPEVRYDWAPFANYDQTIFGFDIIATY